VPVPDGVAAGLGADVPVCLDPRPRLMSGIGEVLAEAPAIPACGLVLVNPGLALATRAVFAARAGGFSAPALYPGGWPDAVSMANDLSSCGNDLEAPAIGLCPAVAEVLEALRGLAGCRLSRMSGSGATCFAVFDTPALASDAAARVARPGWWCWGGGLWQGRNPLGLYAAPPAT
jgi:4-diphosphocytidyl-2-C-methyl-D-erythritol kinase